MECLGRAEGRRMESLSSDHPVVAENLSARLQMALRARESGEADEEDTADILGSVAPIVQAFAAAGLLEFMFMPPGSEEGYVAPSGIDQSDRYARFSVDEAFIDEENQEVVTLVGTVVETTEPAPIIELDEPDPA
jgi:hypothetical protein